MPTATSDPAIRAILRLPFAEQIAFFRGKLGKLVPTKTWRDMLGEAHDRAFTVAGAAKADLLADLAEAVEIAISDGESIDKFRDRFFEIVEKRGWQGWTGEETEAGRYWRTRVIYQTNASTSYSAGRLAQLKDGGFEYWVYRHGGSENPRLQHLAWNGMVLPADHEFWATHYPPNGWGCSCYVVGARSMRGAKRLGGNPDYKEPPDGWNRRDKDGLLPGIDEGWDYQVGRTSDIVQFVEQKTKSLPKPLGSDLREEARTKRSVLKAAIAEVLRRATDDPVPEIEYAAVVKDGATKYIKRGERHAVSFDLREVAEMQGCVLIHNHPNGTSLSREDIALAISGNLRWAVAVSQDGRKVYMARAHEQNRQMFNMKYVVAEEPVYARLWPMIRGGQITEQEANTWHHHILNTLLDRQGIITYRYLGPPPPAWVDEAIKNLARGG